MEKKDLIEFLRRYNRWRKGADIPMPHPKDIGIALEAAVCVMVNADTDVVDFVLKDYEFKYNGEEKV